MSKKIYQVLLIISFLGFTNGVCCGQSGNTEATQLISSDVEAKNMAVKFAPVVIDSLGLLLLVSEQYWDSLNNWSSTDSLPIFLSNPGIDMEFKSFWPSLHSPVSFRKVVIDHTSNIFVLQKILYSSNSAFDNSFGYKNETLDRGQFNVPFQECSLRDLVRLRLDMIGRQEIGNGAN